MVVISKQNPYKQKSQMDSIRRLVMVIFLFFVIVFVYLAAAPEPPSSNNNIVQENEGSNNNNNNSEPTQDEHGLRGLVHKTQNKVATRKKQISHALKSLSASNIPARLRDARERNEIVGEHLQQVRDGTKTVEELLHAAVRHDHQGGGGNAANDGSYSDKAPMEMDEIIDYISSWLHILHDTLQEVKQATHEDIWQAYHDLTVQTLYPWDREYLSRMPQRRDDDSIFISLATYRDENCLNTITWAYEKAAHPEKVFVGLVQQNCHEHCKTGILEGGVTKDAPPDDDCYAQFCASDAGKEHCAKDRVRLLDIDEPESLGPYAARYFASKLWGGETWFLQIDAHMTFATNWDELVIQDLQNAPADKPVLSHYPPSEKTDLDAAIANKEPATRLCGPIFACMDLESQIIRLEGSSKWDSQYLETPRFAPFTAAGFFVAHSSFLREVPFDPFLPWIFMGEEIIMSSRLWTHGYDIFSPSHNLLGHIYVRRHKPKFWESVHRAFTMGIHNPLQILVLDRIKYQLGYPEAAKDIIQRKDLLTAVEQYSMGTERKLDTYMRLVGLNMTTKEVTYTKWCETGQPPQGFEHTAHYYDTTTTD